MRPNLLILLMCCGSALARDPFQPMAGAACIQQVETLPGWRLQGIIGREDHYRAWLLGPQGKIITVDAGQPFPLAPWRLASLTRSRVSLVVENSCSTQTLSFQIKGHARDKDEHFDAGIVLPGSRLRQP